jgi:hypothetical protein
MGANDSTKFLAAVELADAILAEFNDPASKLKGFGTISMDKLLAYRKIAERAPRGKKKKQEEESAPDPI